MRHVYLLLIILFCGCNQNKDNNTHKSFQKKVYSIIDSLNQNLMKDSNLYTITHEKKAKCNYFKISTAQYFNLDSVSSYEQYNDNIIIFYSIDFYNKQVVKQDVINKNVLNKFIYKKDSILFFHPSYIIIKQTNKGFFEQVSLDEQIKLNLFNFSDITINQNEYIPPN